MAMDDKYRLVFCGEILEGQHKAVVKRRLAEFMKLDEARLEKLFSGSSIVIKSDVNKETAAKYQALFKQAGGRLRVLAEQQENAGSTSRTPEIAAVPVPSASAPSVKEVATPFTVQTSFLPPPAEPAPEIDAPDFNVAEVGSNLLDVVELPEVVVPEPNFELANVGEDLLVDRIEVIETRFEGLDFEILEVGADIGDAVSLTPASVPDISHLQLVEAG
jgi:hypothetical protein